MKCVICNEDIPIEANGWDMGHNAQPLVYEGRCCLECNIKYVLPARINGKGLLHYIDGDKPYYAKIDEAVELGIITREEADKKLEDDPTGEKDFDPKVLTELGLATLKLLREESE